MFCVFAYLSIPQSLLCWSPPVKFFQSRRPRSDGQIGATQGGSVGRRPARGKARTQSQKSSHTGPRSFTESGAYLWPPLGRSQRPMSVAPPRTRSSQPPLNAVSGLSPVGGSGWPLTPSSFSVPEGDRQMARVKRPAKVDEGPIAFGFQWRDLSSCAPTVAEGGVADACQARGGT
jgi:hypothetical protein